MPFFNIKILIELFRQINVEYAYLVKFFSLAYTHCKQHLLPFDQVEIEYLDIDEKNIENFSIFYSKWREEFKIKAVIGEIII